jgi:hypothetical protein
MVTSMRRGYDNFGENEKTPSVARRLFDMDNDDRSGRKRGFFRRGREDDFETRPPLGAIDEDVSDDGWVDLTVSADDELRPASPRKTAAMFAPKQKWTDTWGDDAWDDEWKDPAFRRSSIPPAASPGPDQIDAWLDNDREGFGDSTRETISKMGGDPQVADSRPGATWDDTGSGQLSIPSPIEGVAATTSSPTSSPTSNPTSSTGPSTDIESAIEQALASVAPSTPSESSIGDHTEQAELADQLIVLSEGQDDIDATATHSLAIDEPFETPKRSKSSRFRRGSANPSIAESAMANNPRGIVTTPLVSTGSTDHIAEALQTNTEPLDSSATPFEPVASVSAHTSSATSPSSFALGGVTGGSSTVRIFDPSVESEGHDTTNELPPGPDASGTIDSDDHYEEPSAAYYTVEQPTAVESFVDRISWVGAGVALVAAFRLLFLLWSGVHAADPGATLTGTERIGRGFSEAGVTQGMLLVLAVVLLSLPSVFGTTTRDSRIGLGLGLVIGTSTLGILGAFTGFLADRRLADIAGLASGSSTTKMLASLLTAAGLSIVAWAAALRAVRSDDVSPAAATA